MVHVKAIAKLVNSSRDLFQELSLYAIDSRPKNEPYQTGRALFDYIP
jgi:hypothetical protein